jgi:ribosomal protein L37AE/L43A
VQIVRPLGDKPCAFGREWGYDADGIWVSKGCRAEFVVRGKPKPIMRAIMCESRNDSRNQCPAETQFGVAIIRQISERECVLGKSWGFDETGVWVADGCQGQFALGGYRLPPDAVPATASKVTCESLDGGHKHCAVDTSHGVGLIRQISASDCVLNRTWAYDRDGIWVTNGCRAEFAVAH